MQWWKIGLLFFSAFSGGMGVLIFKNKTFPLKLILSFSGAYLFAITVLHLVPEVYESGGVNAGLYILAGFALQVLMEQFSHGVEHGHVHKHDYRGNAAPIAMLISLSLHALLEGVPIADRFSDRLVWGIALHHIPAAFAMTTAFYIHEWKKKTLIILLIVFSSMSPLGYLIGVVLKHGDYAQISNYFNVIIGIVIGMFLHISTTILFESSEQHHFNIKKLIAILIGMSIALFGFFADRAIHH